MAVHLGVVYSEWQCTLACDNLAVTDVVNAPTAAEASHVRTGLDAADLQEAINDHLRYSIGRPAAALRPEHYYRALALAVRDRMQDNRVASTQVSLDLDK